MDQSGTVAAINQGHTQTLGAPPKKNVRRQVSWLEAQPVLPPSRAQRAQWPSAKPCLLQLRGQLWLQVSDPTIFPLSASRWGSTVRR